VGPKAVLERCGKSLPSPGFDPRTVQPVGSRYTDYATRPPRNIGSPPKRWWDQLHLDGQGTGTVSDALEVMMMMMMMMREEAVMV
jgi:hypothetical protein